MLAAQLWQLSEAGEPAVLLGRPVEPADAALFERLLARGVLRHAERHTHWDVCRNCDCGRVDRPVRWLNGQPTAICIADRDRDEILSADDLISFRVSVPDLITVSGAASGLTGPPEEV